MWCEIRLKDGDKLLLGCIYRSPNSSMGNNQQLNQLINKACTRQNSHLLIVGDFNFPEVDWQSWTCNAGDSHPGWAFLDCLQDNFLYQMVEFCTRFRHGQKPSRLDLILTNDEAMICDVTDSSPLGKSDHVVIHFELICYKDFSSEEFVGRYKYDKGDYKKLNEDLSSVQWEEELTPYSVDVAWNVFTNLLGTAMERNIPKTKPPRASKEGKKWKPLWMSNEAMKKVKKKYHAWKRYSNTRQYQDFVNYKRARNAASKEVRFAKKSFEKKLAADIKKNPKSFWKYVRSKTKTKTGIHDLEKEDGSFAHTDEDKAEILNKFFASVFTDEDTTDVPDPEVKVIGRYSRTLAFQRKIF
ncbi:uncharacterized protein [Amphiura filiformis]|uniref:uncharacterized protein n=1 Tax=Amphiura filiformis TaxID=82378 RepID=UPI003B2205DB